jgi:uncharacterized protein YndB with AHSA1/START domain
MSVKFDVDIVRAFHAPRELVYKAFTDTISLAGTEDWEGVPGQDTWSIHRRLEFHEENGGVRLILREGPIRPGWPTWPGSHGRPCS